MKSVAAVVPQGQKCICLTDEVFHFLPPMQQFCCKVVHSLLVNLTPVCAIIAVCYLLFVLLLAVRVMTSDCKHNSHKVQMLLQLIVAVVDGPFSVQ